MRKGREQYRGLRKKGARKRFANLRDGGKGKGHKTTEEHEKIDRAGLGEGEVLPFLQKAAKVPRKGSRQDLLGGIPAGKGGNASCAKEGRGEVS